MCIVHAGGPKIAASSRYDVANMVSAQRIYAGPVGLVLAGPGPRVMNVFSPGRLRVLLAIEEAAGPLTARTA